MFIVSMHGSHHWFPSQPHHRIFDYFLAKVFILMLIIYSDSFSDKNRFCVTSTEIVLLDNSHSMRESNCWNGLLCSYRLNCHSQHSVPIKGLSMLMCKVQGVPLACITS